jgi:thiamine pyrophosphate-dependent acetolactate synthase large subunit-like protein
VFVGDGEMMMGLGSLATVGVDRPVNLSIVVIDNEHYAETGIQLAHAGRGHHCHCAGCRIRNSNDNLY